MIECSDELELLTATDRATRGRRRRRSTAYSVPFEPNVTAAQRERATAVPAELSTGLRVWWTAKWSAWNTKRRRVD